jgi:hypothetical protein
LRTRVTVATGALEAAKAGSARVSATDTPRKRTASRRGWFLLTIRDFAKRVDVPESAYI